MSVVEVDLTKIFVRHTRRLGTSEHVQLERLNYYLARPTERGLGELKIIGDDVPSIGVISVPPDPSVVKAIGLSPVSYTHLTLPTKA